MQYSKNWIMWRIFVKTATCYVWITRNGRIFSVYELLDIGEPQLHPNCECRLERIEAIEAGKATNMGTMDADAWLKYFGELPDYYISEDEAKLLGWVSIYGNLDKVAPGKMLSKGIYKNRGDILPAKKGRIWYEADINYKGGYRNKQRLVFSNDGLVFVTYDHYKTFAEIIGGDK